MHGRYRRLALAFSGMLPLLTQPSKAADQGQRQAAAQSGSELQEVLVTAQKRSESLQDVPASVTAIQPDSLQDAGVDMTKSLSMLTPNLAIDYNANFVATYIRGVGTQYGNPGLEPSVAMYIDDLYLARASAGLLSFNDVERVEVLEGPQGTLYGMNTTGGAIRIITKDATSDFHVGAGVTGGNIGTVGGDAYVNGQITPGLDGRLSVQYEHNNGYVNSALPGGADLENRNMGVVRGKLRWRLSDRLSVRLMADYEEKKDHEGQSFLSFYPGAPQNTGVALGGRASPGFYTATDNITSATPMHLKTGGVELRTDYDLESIRLSSTTGYRYTRFCGFADLDSTSTPLLNAYTILELTRDWSQEFQAVSTGSGPWSWIGGVFYLHENAADNFGIGGIGIAAATGVPNGFTGGYGEESQDMLAPYGQISYKITPQWEVTLGARYSAQQETMKSNVFYVTTTTEPDGFVPVAPYLSTALSPRRQFLSNTLAPKLEVTWRPFSNAMFYASYTKAYKSGGFNLPQPAPTPPQEVQDEAIKAAEVGWKTQFGRVRFNGAYFHYNESNLQVQVADTRSGITSVQNAAAATTDGFESTVDVAAARGLVIGGAVGYLNAKFNDFPDGQTNVPCLQDPSQSGCNGTPVGVGTGGADLSGKVPPLAPRWTGNIHADYNFSLPNDLGSMRMSATESYTSSVYFTPDDFYKQSSAALLAASASWSSPDSHYSVRAYGTNLTNKKYRSHIVPFAAGTIYVPAPPREYGVRVACDF